MGDRGSSKLLTFLQSQEVQAPFVVPTKWLSVGHIDEVFAFTPAGNEVVVADPTDAYALLNTIPVADRGKSVFFATGGLPVSGTAGAAISNRLYDGPATGEIKTVAKSKLKDGETFTIGDGAATKTFEFDTNGSVAAGRVAVNISGATTADDVRDAIIAAINGAAGLAVSALENGAATVHLFNKNMGTSGNVPIAETVADVGFSVSGMSGGKSGGTDFSTGSWEFIRIFDHSGSGSGAAGQVAHIITRGKGFIVIDAVWNTTSKIIGGGASIMTFAFSSFPPAPTWVTLPKAGDKYVVTEGTRFWAKGTPAIVTVAEVLADTELADLNKIDIQGKIDSIKTTLQTEAGGGLTFVKVPTIYFGKRAGFNTGESGVAFTPGLANVQPVNSKLYFPRQFGPRNAAGEDIFEKTVKSRLANALFVDDWDLYHRREGEVHCGSSTRRQFPGLDWWSNQP